MDDLTSQTNILELLHNAKMNAAALHGGDGGAPDGGALLLNQPQDPPSAGQQGESVVRLVPPRTAAPSTVRIGCKCG